MIDPLDLLQGLVAIPSLPGQESAAVAYLTEQMAELAYQTRIDEAGNAVGIREVPDEIGAISNEIMLLGHIDTVPGEVPLRVENGRLYGRGSVDAKGPLAAFVIAGAQAALPPGTRLVVVGAVEEESATSKGAWHISEQYRPDYCIIGEPSGWDALTLGYKGRVLFDYNLSQKMSHSAGPVPAAAEFAVAWWNQIKAYCGIYNRSRAQVYEQISPSLRNIQSHSDGLVNSVQASVGVRIPPGLELTEFISTVKEFAPEAEVRAYGAVPAYKGERSNNLVRQFSSVFRQHGLRPRFKLKSGTSDMNVVGPAWDCPVVAYGPGDSWLDHTPDEHIVIKEYLRGISILSQVLGQLSSPDEIIREMEQIGLSRRA